MTNVELDGERALLTRLKAREGDAFDQLYAEYHPRLFNFLARLTRRRDVAEDLVEELWLRVVAHAPRLREDTQLAPWLFTIARNLYASYCRSRRIPFDALDDGDSGSIAGHDPSPFETASATQLQGRIEAALAALPGRYREALLLVAIEGLSPAEAARVCGVRPEAMRQRLSRGRALLARRLEAQCAAPMPLFKEVLP
jgi:RNA polymerase sigma factor (sigma-70 family)